MSQQKREGRGRLVPMQPTGVEYRVKYGIELVIETRPHGKGMRPPPQARWEKCSVRPSEARRIPDGTYFLHADEGGVYQLKAKGGEWLCLAA